MADSDGRLERVGSGASSLYAEAVDVVLTGFAIIVPLVVTLYVLRAALGFVAGALEPAVRVMSYFGLIEGFRDAAAVQWLFEVGIVDSGVTFLTQLIAVVILFAGIVAVGLVGRHRYGERLIDYFDALVAAVPGIGTVYKSFRRMGDVMRQSDVDNFREVKLVEFPRDGAFVVGFETNESPPAVRESADHESMTTLFLPLAPNPVMGGFLAHIPDDRVRDVDMTVEEGVRSIITSGIATDPEGGDRPPDLSDVRYVGGVFDRGDDPAPQDD